MFKPTNPEAAAIIQRLEGALCQLSIGAVLSSAELSRIAGCDVNVKHRYLLVRARENAEKRMGCIFESVRGEGIKRLTSSECPEVGLAALRKCRRAARRGGKRLERLNVNSLSEPEQKRVISYRSMLGAVALVADGNKARTIAAVAEKSSPIPPASILQMFSAA